MSHLHDQSVRPKMRLRFGRGGLIYVVMTSFNLAVALYVQANLLFWTFGLLIGGLVVSVMIPPLMLWRLKVTRAVPEHGIAGQPMMLQYEVANQRGWLASFGVVIHETWGRGRQGHLRTGPIAEYPQRLRARPHGWVVHIGARQTVHAPAACWPLRRGTLRFEAIVLSCSFPFGIFEQTAVYDAPGEVLIYPPIHRLERRVIATLRENEPRGRRLINQGGGQEEFYSLRKYREGDSIKVIDWRRTARTGEFISKEMTRPSPPKVMILLDIAERSIDRDHEDESQGKLIEQAISLTASLVCEAYGRGYQIGLAVRGAPCPPMKVYRSIGHRTKMLEMLAKLDTTNQMTDSTPLPAQPSVVIRPQGGESGRPTQPGAGAIVLTAANFDRYISQMDASPVNGAGS
jgi:uncharacterized protein (DUF58 family)